MLPTIADSAAKVKRWFRLCVGNSAPATIRGPMLLTSKRRIRWLELHWARDFSGVDVLVVKQPGGMNGQINAGRLRGQKSAKCLQAGFAGDIECLQLKFRPKLPAEPGQF